MVKLIEETVKVGQKGQIVIPKAVRQISGIAVGMKVNVIVEDGNVLIKKPPVDIVKVFERIAKAGKSVKDYDSDKAYDEMMAERWKKRRLLWKKMKYT